MTSSALPCRDPHQGIDDSLRQLIRYQFGNHLGSASLELDVMGQIISYEEYFPYGARRTRRCEARPRRRSATIYGMERDEESGLSYHRARYYAP